MRCFETRGSASPAALPAAGGRGLPGAGVGVLRGPGKGPSSPAVLPLWLPALQRGEGPIAAQPPQTSASCVTTPLSLMWPR